MAKSTLTFFHYIAALGIAASSVAVISLLITVPMLMRKASLVSEEVAEASARYRTHSNRLWQQMMELEEKLPAPSKQSGISSLAIQYFTRVGRSPWNKHLCSGCHSLSCQMGPAGPNGPPGVDGAPGDSGKQGDSGLDGFDVQLEPEHDLPCVICPAGPPGQRGTQGERGMSGEKGSSGDQGQDGRQGIDGPPGKRGPPGVPGVKGPLGRPGPQGDQVVAGVGIKGPQGPPGSSGPKGPPGVPGKPSKEAGPVGKPGSIGALGAAGRDGDPGPEGSWGAPGEPGEPSAYCPSDCGVSKIVAPSYASQLATPGEAPSAYPNGGGGGSPPSVTSGNSEGPEAPSPIGKGPSHGDGYSFFWVH